MNKTMTGLVALIAGLMLASGAAAQSAMPVVELTAGFHRIEAEVAATTENRMVGLMNRRSMPAQRGMVFAFTQENTHCMWMRNTFVPLSVAFIDGDGVIINIEDMQPQTETSHCSKKPARYALEMNQGWFAQRGIKPGAKLGGLERLPPPR
jgi:uncharacterized membrane protein (UPF0127 family)